MGIAGGPWLLGKNISSVCEQAFRSAAEEQEFSQEEVRVAAELDEQPVGRKGAESPKDQEDVGGGNRDQKIGEVESGQLRPNATQDAGQHQTGERGAGVRVYERGGKCEHRGCERRSLRRRKSSENGTSADRCQDVVPTGEIVGADVKEQSIGQSGYQGTPRRPSDWFRTIGSNGGWLHTRSDGLRRRSVEPIRRRPVRQGPTLNAADERPEKPERAARQGHRRAVSVGNRQGDGGGVRCCGTTHLGSDIWDDRGCSSGLAGVRSPDSGTGCIVSSRFDRLFRRLRIVGQGGGRRGRVGRD